MRLVWLSGSLALALLLAVITLQTPRPVGADAPATDFSAARAMVDVREIAQRPHPLGSTDHARVRDYLFDRMTALGLAPAPFEGPLSPQSIRRSERQGQNPAGVGYTVVNLVGVLPGRDADAPAVLIMAHYDTVPGSPGAADDSAGVASVLEAVRAIRARGGAERTLVVLFTDAEELGLDGARVFFGGHPLRDRIGAIVNLEARGGGGRAMMFETGPGNAETIALFARTAGRATGGPASSSLGVFVYEQMPNGTDFTIPRARGIPGVNFAFIGRPEQYHSAASVPAALDQGSVQHIGSQALETADALLRAPALPVAGSNVVYSDILGWFVLMHSAATGWLLLLLTAGLGGLAAWRVSRRSVLSPADIGRGALDGLWFLATAAVLAQAVRLLAGPMTARAASADVYYTLLARLPWMEAATALTVLAVGLLLLAGRDRIDRRVMAAVVAVATVGTLVVGGFNIVILALALLSVGLTLVPGLASRTVWGGWLGLIALTLGLGLIVQILAPEAALIFVWPGLLAAAAAAITAFSGPGLDRPAALAASAVAGVLGGAWLFGMAHFVFLGVGIDLPAAMALIGLLVLMLIRPLAPTAGMVRPVLIAAVTCLLIASGLSAAARWAEPAAKIASRTADA
ncbi:M20/M25/M40 family metallo-hydrolase [uncultured Brevundimonas sp.]|uniref:M20/M25/M40 family metallo-hydrolase n=1 Tax=uncultured Brevundimonas sp. TaxID=213418 RepID=UPI0030EBA58B|tara:strand:+ start:101067 stop:102959 length:1893 start_codon:yes stop_codon:yes gene_type:complete